MSRSRCRRCATVREVIGASKAGRDITERKQAEKLQQVLVDELNHRVRNTLATVQAIASQSLVHAKNPAEFVPSFTGRVQALAKAHALLTRSEMRGAELMDPCASRCSSGSPTTVASPARARCSCSTRRRRCTWRSCCTSLPRTRASTARCPCRTVVSRSSGRCAERRRGPAVAVAGEQRSKGPVSPCARFGSTLIEQTLRARRWQGSVHYGSDGVTCEMNCPSRKRRGRASRSPHSRRGTRAALRCSICTTTGSLCRAGGLSIEDEPLVAMELGASLTAAGCEVRIRGNARGGKIARRAGGFRRRAA